MKITEDALFKWDISIFPASYIFEVHDFFSSKIWWFSHWAGSVKYLWTTSLFFFFNHLGRLSCFLLLEMKETSHTWEHWSYWNLTLLFPACVAGKLLNFSVSSSSPLLEDIDNINMATDPRPLISGNYYCGPNCSHLCFTGDDFLLIKCLWSEWMSESIGQCGFS